MILRYILHVEFHWGYRPRINLRRAPRSGDRVTDGGIPGTLRRCALCGDGFLHEPDPRAVPAKGGQQRHPTATVPVNLNGLYQDLDSESGDYWIYRDPPPSS